MGKKKDKDKKPEQKKRKVDKKELEKKAKEAEKQMKKETEGSLWSVLFIMLVTIGLGVWFLFQ